MQLWEKVIFAAIVGGVTGSVIGILAGYFGYWFNNRY